MSRWIETACAVWAVVCCATGRADYAAYMIGVACWLAIRDTKATGASA